MKEDKKTPIEILSDALASMTERALEAERERDSAKKRADEWYQSWKRKDEEAKELQTMLSAEIKGHGKTKAELEEAVRAVNVLNDELERMRKTEPIETLTQTGQTAPTEPRKA